MSHQTGIKANDELEEFFSLCKTKDVRTLAVKIEDECLMKHSWATAISNWKDDYTSQVLPLLQEKTPRYILFRLDASPSSLSDDWLLLLWSPEDSPVRQKMLYASTKATLKRQFGSTQIKEEIFASSADEASVTAVIRHRKSSTPAPLTTREEELAEVRRQEGGADVGIDTKHQTLPGVSFPLTTSADAALRAFADGKLQYVRLRIDLDKEIIEVEVQQTRLKASALREQVPEKSARYHLYRYDHNWEADLLHSVVFIYSMPGYSCPIKERMVYSSSANPITSYLQNVLHLNIGKKIEISEGSEITEDFLCEELHPKQNLHKPKFNKPKGPASRGQKRLTKLPPEQD